MVMSIIQTIRIFFLEYNKTKTVIPVSKTSPSALVAVLNPLPSFVQRNKIKKLFTDNLVAMVVNQPYKNFNVSS